MIPKKISTSDPESSYYVKGEREKQFAYSAHTNGFILATLVTPGNVHDSQVAINLVKQAKRAFPTIKHVVADTGYKNPKFVHFLTQLKLRAILPYTTPRGVKGMLRKNDLSMMTTLIVTYAPLINSTITRDGYRTYKSNLNFCMSCSLLEYCTLNETHQKIETGRSRNVLL